MGETTYIRYLLRLGCKLPLTADRGSHTRCSLDPGVRVSTWLHPATMRRSAQHAPSQRVGRRNNELKSSMISEIAPRYISRVPGC